MIRQRWPVTRVGVGSGRVGSVGLVLGIVALLAFSMHSVNAAGEPLDGRLGGTYASFIERFGEPTDQVGGLGLVFERPETRYLAVQFGPSDNAYGQDDPALVLTVSADRDELLPADQVASGDWTRDEAQAIAADLTPTDAVFAAVDASLEGTRTATCSSDALLEAFGTVSLGECRATYLLSSEETVSFLTLTLTSGAETGPVEGSPEAACTGVVEWANASATRLANAQTSLETLGTLSEDPVVAVADLRTLAVDLDLLAGEQRSAPTPTEVATANYYIIGALSDFAAAVERAADGLEGDDQALLDEAVDDLDAADERAARASGEIESAVTACDLTTGTPEAG